MPQLPAMPPQLCPLGFCLFSIVYRSVCLASLGFACQEMDYHRYTQIGFCRNLKLVDHEKMARKYPHKYAMNWKWKKKQGRTASVFGDNEVPELPNQISNFSTRLQPNGNQIVETGWRGSTAGDAEKTELKYPLAGGGAAPAAAGVGGDCFLASMLAAV
jgi:hypothetical protein